MKKTGKPVRKASSTARPATAKAASSKTAPSKAASPKPALPKTASSRPAAAKGKSAAPTSRAKSRGATAPRAKAKPVEKVVREPRKKHILIKRKKDDALSSDVTAAAFPDQAAPESMTERPVLPDVAAAAPAAVDESPASAPAPAPALESPAPAAPPAAPSDPAKVVDEKAKAKDDAKQKKVRKTGKQRNSDLFAEIYEDAAMWQDLRPLPALRRDERARHVPSATPGEVTKARRKAVKLASGITVKEFAERLGLRAADVIRKLMDMGIAGTMNQPMNLDAGVLIAEGAGIDVEVQAGKEGDDLLEDLLEPGAEPELVPRAPVVTVMGHVDHGKTSLLDAIRQTSVTEREAGGITQHIGAYVVGVGGGDGSPNGNAGNDGKGAVRAGGKQVTFLDTPGHEAFTAMRARGAQVTDLVVLVVAADDGVMPQTLEAARHAQAAHVPILVAINKMDTPGANPDRVRQGLSEHGLIPETWGGQTIYSEVSAKEKRGLETLLEMILLQAEVLELRADVGRAAKGVVLEARLDRGRGPVATVLVQGGVLNVGDTFVVGATSGRVRAMRSHDGKAVKAAGPSTPVEVIGLLGLPAAGDSLVVVKEERVAREIAESRQSKRRAAELGAGFTRPTLDDLLTAGQGSDKKVLSVLVKADTQGSLGALCEAVEGLSSEAVELRILHRGVGGITESDVLLASASRALVMGFHVRPEPGAAAVAEREGIDVRLHTVIYRAIADLKSAAEGLLEPTLTERVLGRAEVRQVFTIPKVGTIAGSYVHDGQIARASEGVRLLRDNVVVHEGTLGSLRRFKDDVREVAQGYECGIGIENFNDIKVGDVIEAYAIEKEAAKL